MRVLLLLLLSLPVWAENLYVRPAEGTYGASDGSNYANAFDGFADVVWGAAAGQVSDGDTLFVCGAFDLDSVDGGATVMVSIDTDGSSTSSRVTLDGACNGEDPITQATLDGETTRDRGIDSGGTGRTFITLKNMIVRNFDAKGIFSQGTNTTTRAWRLENVDVEGVRGSTADCIDLRGAGHYIASTSSVANCGDDAMYVEGDNLTLGEDGARVVCVNPSLDGVTGDCLQVNAEGDTFTVRIDCTMPTDAKQCVFVSTTGFTGSGTVEDSRCYGPSASATLHTCYFFEDLSGTVTVRRSYGEKSRYLIYVGGVATTLVARGNVGHSFTSFGIQCGSGGSTDCVIVNNSLYNAPTCISTADAVGTSTIRNNAMSGCTTAGIRKNSGDVESNNLIHASAKIVQNETTDTTPDTTDLTVSPQWNSAAPSTLEGFRMSSASPLRMAGLHLNIGTYQDATRIGFKSPPSIGGLEARSAAARTAASTRTAATTRTAASARTAR